MFPRKFSMVFVTFHLQLLFTYSNPNDYTLTLIPPLSPLSPFYPNLLIANNISLSSTATEVMLDKSHVANYYIISKQIAPASHTGGFVYVMFLELGNPQQQVSGIFDTGSDIIWFQCQSSISGARKNSNIFNQTKSTSYNEIDCRDKFMCNRTLEEIKGCRDATIITSTKRGCVYHSSYADYTSSIGVMSTDITPWFSSESEKLAFGCSFRDADDCMGIIGASKSEYSLPYQLHPNDPKFSYCFSHDLTKNCKVRFAHKALLLGRPFQISPKDFDTLYYINPIGMRVDGEVILMDFKDNKTGMVIDSGSSYTSLTMKNFDALKNYVEFLVGPATAFEPHFEICYDIDKLSSLPWGIHRPIISLAFTKNPDDDFTFNTDQVWLKLPNYKLECLTIARDDQPGISILGNFQLLSTNVGYDLLGNRLYLDKNRC